MQEKGGEKGEKKGGGFSYFCSLSLMISESKGDPSRRLVGRREGGQGCIYLLLRREGKEGKTFVSKPSLKREEEERGGKGDYPSSSISGRGFRKKGGGFFFASWQGESEERGGKRKKFCLLLFTLGHRRWGSVKPATGERLQSKKERKIPASSIRSKKLLVWKRTM